MFVRCRGQGSQFHTVPAGMAGIYRTDQCTSTSTPLASYRKKYWPYRRNPAVSANKNVSNRYKQEEKKKKERKKKMRKSEKGRERGRASEGRSCEREIICCFTLFEKLGETSSRFFFFLFFFFFFSFD